MATHTIAWNDGTGDTFDVIYTGEVGRSDLTISGAENKTARQRQQVVTLKTADGITLDTLTVSQNPRSRDYSVGYSTDYE